MENCQFIDGSPIKNGGSFHGELLNNQMVPLYIYIYIPLLNPHRFPSHLLIFPLETWFSPTATASPTRTESLEKAAGGFLVDDGLAQPRYSFLEYS